MNKNQILIRKMVIIAILSAISLVLYIIGPKFSLPIFPSFLSINFSMLPIFIGLFLLGYKEALIILVIRFVIKLPFTSNSGVGEFADLLLGLIILSGTALANKLIKLKGNKKDVLVFLCAIISWLIAGLISNCFSLPLYMKMYGGKEVIISAMSMIKGVNANNYFVKYLFCAALPFNAIISGIVVLITYLINFRLKVIYKRFQIDKNEKQIEEKCNE